MWLFQPPWGGKTNNPCQPCQPPDEGGPADFDGDATGAFGDDDPHLPLHKLARTAKTSASHGSSPTFIRNKNDLHDYCWPSSDGDVTVAGDDHRYLHQLGQPHRPPAWHRQSDSDGDATATLGADDSSPSQPRLPLQSHNYGDSCASRQDSHSFTSVSP